MAKKRIFFFATPEDIVPLLHRFEASGAVRYAEIASHASPDLAQYLTIDEIPDPGISTHETGNASRSYLVIARNQEFLAGSSRSADGERRWHLNNGDNDGSVSLTMAGKWKDMLLPETGHPA